MFNQLPAQMERKPAWVIVLNIALAGLIAGTVALWCGFYLLPPVGWYADHPFTTSASWLFDLVANASTQAGQSQPLYQHFLEPMAGVRVFLANIEHFDLIAPLSWRIFAAIFIATVTALGVGLYTYRGLERVDRLKHIRGRRLRKGRKAVRHATRAQRKSMRKSGCGIKIAPGLPISLETETRHFLLVGASGGGKTQTLLYWIDQLLAGRDKLLIHDTKGDMTASLPQDDYILLAPHDKRSWAWDIARDCKGLAAARELASRLIVLGSDPIWGNGAREILTGIIRSLQVDFGVQWDWKNLSERAFSSPADILSFLNNTHPEGARYIEIDEETGTPNKTTFSFLVTLWASIGSIVSPLAAAWGDVADTQKISLTAWLANNDVEHRTIILQRSSEFSDLSEAWIGAAVQLMANFAASASFGDSTQRRIWLFLDEFAQLGKVKGFQQFLEVGRSRGIRCAIGLQDLEQLSDLYGEEVLKTWLNTIETKIICRMNAGPSAKFIADELIGQREVSWKERSITDTTGHLFENQPGTRSVNDQIKTATVPIILPDYLEREIGPKFSGGNTQIRALLLVGGELYQLDWPITHWPNRREASEPAAWIKE